MSTFLVAAYSFSKLLLFLGIMAFQNLLSFLIFYSDGSEIKTISKLAIDGTDITLIGNLLN
jgi:hypothetical protein